MRSFDEQIIVAGNKSILGGSIQFIGSNFVECLIVRIKR